MWDKFINNINLTLGLTVTVFSGVALGIASYISYKKHCLLTHARNLEYEKFNEKWDNIIKNYKEYNFIIEEKNDLIKKTQDLEKLLNSNDIGFKFTNASVLQNNDELFALYRKWNSWDIKLEQTTEAIKVAEFHDKPAIMLYCRKFNSTVRPLISSENLKLDAILDLNSAHLYNFNNVDDLKKKVFSLIEKECFVDTESLKYRTVNVDVYTREYAEKKKILETFGESRVLLDSSTKNFTSLIDTQEELTKNLKEISDPLIKEANVLLQWNLTKINEQILNCSIQEIEIIDLNKEKFPLLEQYLISKSTLNKNQPDLIKDVAWQDNEVNKLYLNSNHTYFWLCYEEFCKNVKNKIIYHFSKKPDHPKVFKNDDEFLRYHFSKKPDHPKVFKNDDEFLRYHFSKKPDHPKVLDHDKFLKDNEAFFKNIQYNTKPPLNWGKKPSTNLHFIEQPEFQLINTNHSQWDSFYFDLFVFSWQIYFFQHIYLLQYIIPIIYSVIALLVGYVLYKKIKYAYSCYKQKILKVTFLNWLFDPEILFTTSKLGIFYTITIIVLLGILYNFSGFGYWFTFLICGRVFVWNWIKYILYKLKLNFSK